jgi:hypothetical protein
MTRILLKNSAKPAPDSISRLKFKVGKVGQALGEGRGEALKSGVPASVVHVRQAGLPFAAVVPGKQKQEVDNLDRFIALLETTDARLRTDANSNAFLETGRPEDTTEPAICAALEDCFLKAERDLAKFPFCGLFHQHVATQIKGQESTHKQLAAVVKNYERCYGAYVAGIKQQGWFQ